MQKRVITLLIISLVIVFISAGFISAIWCGIVPKTSCNLTSEKYIVMGVSGLTNAHGEFPYSSYPYVLCCDFQVEGGTTCVGANKIIGLSSSTNAHAEEPSRTTYTNSVCYDDLQCISTLGSCPRDYPLPVLSLSNYTNAHIGNIGDYSIKICCNGSATRPLTCDLTNASWEYKQVREGVQVGLIVKGTGCDGVNISFEVFRQNYILGIPLGSTSCSDIDGCSNPSNAIFIGNTATGTWNAFGPNKEYYFIATVVANPSETINSKTIGNPLLEVEQMNPDDCVSITICGDYTILAECNSDFCNRAANSAPPGVDCSNPSIECGCAWDTGTNTCEFSVDNETGTCKYKEQTTDDCSDGYLTYNWTATWTGNESERPSWCLDGSKVIECPAQVQLPFFNTYTLIAVIIIIALIYVMSKRKKKKTGSKRRGKTRKK